MVEFNATKQVVQFYKAKWKIKLNSRESWGHTDVGRRLDRQRLDGTGAVEAQVVGVEATRGCTGEEGRWVLVPSTAEYLRFDFLGNFHRSLHSHQLQVR